MSHQEIRAVSIRMACASDVDGMARLTSQLGYDVPVSAVQARLCSILARFDQRFLIAEDSGDSVGWLHAMIIECLETDRFVMIAGLVVDRGHRRQGIGRLLMRHAEQWADEQGCRVVRLWSSAARAAAHRFYEEIGYTNIKTQYSFAKLSTLSGKRICKGSFRGSMRHVGARHSGRKRGEPCFRRRTSLSFRPVYPSLLPWPWARRHSWLQAFGC